MLGRLIEGKTHMFHPLLSQDISPAILLAFHHGSSWKSRLFSTLHSLCPIPSRAQLNILLCTLLSVHARFFKFLFTLILSFPFTLNPHYHPLPSGLVYVLGNTRIPQRCCGSRTRTLQSSKYHNKLSHTKGWVFFFVLFPSAYKSCLHYTVVY